MTASNASFSNPCFDVWLTGEGNLDWIEFGQEYACDPSDLVAAVSFLYQRGFVTLQGDTLRLAASAVRS